MEDRIIITITRMGDEFFTNAVHGESFICTTRQPDVLSSLGSAMEWIRKEAEKLPGGEYFMDEDDDFEDPDAKDDDDAMRD